MMRGVTVIRMSLWLRVWLGAENRRPRIGSIPTTGIVARLSPLLSCLTQATTAVIPSCTREIVVSERLVNEGLSVESVPEASTLLDSSFIFTCTYPSLVIVGVTSMTRPTSRYWMLSTVLLLLLFPVEVMAGTYVMPVRIGRLRPTTV